MSLITLETLSKFLEKLQETIGESWISNHVYEVGDIVLYHGRQKRNLAHHTSGATFDSTEAAYWVDLTIHDIINEDEDIASEAINLLRRGLGVSVEGEYTPIYPNSSSVKDDLYCLKDNVSGILMGTVFKGTIGLSSSSPTVTELPLASSETLGWTYRVVDAGTYSGIAASVGDNFVCKADGGLLYSWMVITSPDLATKENVSNKVTSFENPTDVQYPSAKLVKDSLDNKVNVVQGKGLSTIDYTPVDKLKIDKFDFFNDVDLYLVIAGYQQITTEILANLMEFLTSFQGKELFFLFYYGYIPLDKLTINSSTEEVSFSLRYSNNIYTFTVGAASFKYTITTLLPKLVGTSAQRPSSPSQGDMYYDSSYKKPLWYDGTVWRDANGESVI